ncbi:hypothetical protein [Pedobacter sp. Leaf194]|uniref:hypothetical protein n=1 Tax=Pedobacter sp. Leaf194 TaxID=1736297 RepID=UPI000B2ACF33|nr:hypothetical protein [Pedobacter sp. Leaf194]
MKTLSYQSVTLNIFVLLFLTTLVMGCKDGKPDLNTVKHQRFVGIRKQDTTIAVIKVAGTDFYGSMEVLYHVGMKDSGIVKGKLYGDTLFAGDYYHLHDGQDHWMRVPLRLLKRQNKLILGEGVIAYFANMPFFVHYPPVLYDEQKQFVLYPKN